MKKFWKFLRSKTSPECAMELNYNFAAFYFFQLTVFCIILA